MEDKIKEVQKYFKNKMLTGDFLIEKIKEYTIELRVDSLYKFVVWVGNWNIRENRNLYHADYNFMDINMNKKEREKLHSILKKPYEKYLNEELLIKKREQFEELKKELGE